MTSSFAVISLPDYCRERNEASLTTDSRYREVNCAHGRGWILYEAGSRSDKPVSSHQSSREPVKNPPDQRPHTTRKKTDLFSTKSSFIFLAEPI